MWLEAKKVLLRKDALKNVAELYGGGQGGGGISHMVC